MDYQAELYIGDCLYKTIIINRPIEQIVFTSPRRLDFPVAAFDEPLTPVMFKTDTMMFRIKDQQPKYRYGILQYAFDYATGAVNTFGQDVEHIFDDGFVEPDENVNLDKLLIKLRDNKRMKKLLLSFYRTS